jgi:hypothetical protein
VTGTSDASRTAAPSGTESFSTRAGRQRAPPKFLEVSTAQPSNSTSPRDTQQSTSGTSGTKKRMFGSVTA